MSDRRTASLLAALVVCACGGDSAAPDISAGDTSSDIVSSDTLDAVDLEQLDRTDVAETMETPSVVAGTVTYVDHPYDLEGWAPDTVALPVRGALVELVQIADGVVLASAVTSDDGTYELQLSIRSPTFARLEVVSIVSGAGIIVTVVDREDVAPYRVTTERFLIRPGEDLDLVIEISAAETAPAFNIADVAVEGLRFIRTRLPELPPDDLDLEVIWALGVESPCGTCFNGFRIDLTGAPEDPDGYDDDIILHEVGHFVQAHLSFDDSPGGRHDGTPTDPTLAYGEGFAHFFSCWVRGEPTYVDYRTSDWRQKNVEDLEDDYLGTTDATMTGDVSEFLVSSVFWDLVDPAGNEPHDQLDHEDALIMTLFGRMAESRPRDLGVIGVDLADFIDNVRCELESGEDLDHLAAVLAHIEYPFDFEFEADCE